MYTKELEKLPNLKVIDTAPYDRLVTLVKAIIHHGGIGTITACLKAGKPFLTDGIGGAELVGNLWIIKIAVGTAGADRLAPVFPDNPFAFLDMPDPPLGQDIEFLKADLLCDIHIELHGGKPFGREVQGGIMG